MVYLLYIDILFNIVKFLFACFFCFVNVHFTLKLTLNEFKRHLFIFSAECHDREHDYFIAFLTLLTDPNFER